MSRKRNSCKPFKLGMNGFISIIIGLLLLLQISFHSYARPLVDGIVDEGHGKETSNLKQLSSEASADETENGKYLETMKPMETMKLNDNYDMVIMTNYYKNHPAKSMQLQTFAEFYDPQISGVGDLNMDENYNFPTNF